MRVRPWEGGGNECAEANRVQIMKGQAENMEMFLGKWEPSIFKNLS